MTTTEEGGTFSPLVIPDLLPGDALRITGHVGQWSDDYSPGNIVDSASTVTHHMTSLFVKIKEPISMEHTCTVINEDVTFTLEDSLALSIPIEKITMCERNITDIAFKVIDLSVDAHDPSLNVADPYYTWAGFDETGSHFLNSYLTEFSIGGPMDFIVSFVPPTEPDQPWSDLTDYPLVDGSTYSVEYPFSIATANEYQATITASNHHNDIYVPPSHTITINALYPVLDVWTMTPQALEFLVPTTMPTFEVTSSTGGPIPTDAKILMDWGDGTDPELFDFVDPLLFSHLYVEDGVYNQEAIIYNIVSSSTVSSSVTIIEAIIDLEIYNGYFFKPVESTATLEESRPAFGRLKNQYPMDKNLTFFPSTTQGTIEKFIVTHTDNQSEILTFTPTERFDPLVDHFQHHFDFETFLNLTVTAKNSFESVSIDLFLEIVGQVRVLKINDHAIVTKFDEEKFFEITFESV